MLLLLKALSFCLSPTLGWVVWQCPPERAHHPQHPAAANQQNEHPPAIS